MPLMDASAARYTLYPTVPAPPSFAGANQAREICPSPSVAAKPVGDPGTVADGTTTPLMTTSGVVPPAVTAIPVVWAPMMVFVTGSQISTVYPVPTGAAALYVPGVAAYPSLTELSSVAYVPMMAL